MDDFTSGITSTGMIELHAGKQVIMSPKATSLTFYAGYECMQDLYRLCQQVQMTS